MTPKPIVLIVGITGMLGNKIASAILDKGTMAVRAIIRPDAFDDDKKHQALEGLRQRGVEFVSGDLFNSDSLRQACENVEGIVSAVSGDETSVVSGQLNLIEAAASQGVKRMIPSDYSVDYRKLDWGDNYNLDMRKKVLAALEQSPIAYTLILNGCFTEILFGSFLKVFDPKTSSFRYWGDGEMLFDTTTTDDTAKYIAEAIADPEMANAALEIAGDVISMQQVIQTYEQVTGKSAKVEQRGTVEDLKQWIEQTKATATDPYAYLPEQYLYAMVSGKGKLEQINSDRYPQIVPTSVAEYMQRSEL